MLPKIRRTWIIAIVLCIAVMGALLAGPFEPQSAQEKRAASGLPEKFAKSDAVTYAIRSSGNESIRVPSADLPTVAKLKVSGVLVADHGSFLVYAAPKGTLAGLGKVTSAQILETSVNVPGSSFDPLTAGDIKGTIVPGDVQRQKAGDGYYIVQFGTVATDELLESLRSTGADIIQYIPHQAFLVYASTDAIANIAEHDRVRWVGSYLPEHKVDRVLKEQLKGRMSKEVAAGRISALEQSDKGTAIFDVAVFGRADLDIASENIKALYEGTIVQKIELNNNFFNVLRVELPVRNVEFVADIPDVFSITAWSRPQKEDEVAAQIVAGNYIGNTISPPGYDPLTQFGVDGSNVTVSVVDDGIGIPGDGGFYITAGNAVNGPLRSATTGASGHGHLNATIIAGTTPFSTLDPNGYNYALGISPKAHLINIPFLRSGYTGSEADTANDTIVTNGPNGVKGSISNNSWGNGTNSNAYDSYAAQFDGFVRDASSAATIDPLLLVFSAGNSGTLGLTRPKVAKNVIAVAATENLRPTLPSSGGTTGVADDLEQLPDFSSRGPAADGRIKPDIAAPGDAVAGGRSGTSALFGNIDTYHRVSSGTSHAAPQVAGAAALFTQFWKNGHSGNYPSPAMVKAALINGAVDVTGTGATAARPNGNEGWGRIDLSNVLNTGTVIGYFDQTITLNSVGVIKTFAGSVADPSKPVRVSLVWTDPPGAADPALVNDLDLKVVVNGSTYLGNVLSGGVSTTGGASDNRNNVENVFLPSGQSGPISVTVTASALNGDGVLGNADTTDQNFALVVYNADPAPPAPSALLLPGTPVVSTGNGIIEPLECDLVDIPLSNEGDGSASAISAVLTTTTPGVTIVNASSGYMDLAPGAAGPNSVPFLISTDNTVTCGSTIDLKLTVTYAGGETSPVEITRTLTVGQPEDPNYSFTGVSGQSLPAGGTLVAGSRDDDAVLNITAPFAFSLYGTPVASGTTLRVSTNGNLQVTASGGSSRTANGTLPNAGAVGLGSGSFPASSPVLMPYWDDLIMTTARLGTTGGIYQQVTGTAPGRQWIIEWRAQHFNNVAADGVTTQFAIIFNENSDHFSYVYISTGTGSRAGGAEATVGVQAATTGARFTAFSVNTASLASGLRLDAARAPSICSTGTGSCAITAADVTLSGKVVTAYGRGVKGAVVTLDDGSGDRRNVITNSFGYFRITGIAAGRSYVLSAQAKGLSFASSLLNAADDISDVTIIASP